VRCLTKLKNLQLVVGVHVNNTLFVKANQDGIVVSMHLWLLLWLIVAVSETLLYVFSSTSFFARKNVRVFLGTVLLISILATAIGILAADWRVWLAPAFVTPYRLVNVARYMKYRLQPDRLRSVSLQAHIWLIVLQILLFAIGWFAFQISVVTLFGVILSVQLVVILVLLRSTIQTWENAKPTKTEHHYTDKELPSLSVLIPARNETEELQRCLSSLTRSDYPKLEILVLDDCSQERRTPEIIRSFAQSGVRFIKGVEPEEANWVAKNHACEQLRTEASGSMLLFTSADTEFDPGTLRVMVEHMLTENDDMLSVLPRRLPQDVRTMSFLQPMRYYWELCLPRRMSKRPPVLSTCWMIRSDRLDEYGGFDSVRQSISPESHFARKAVIADAYSFLRSSDGLEVYSIKDQATQYNTTIRLRYPQLHRRLELVTLTSLFELLFLAGPFAGMVLSFFLPYTMAFGLAWAAAALAIEVTYYYAAVETRHATFFVALVTAPFAILVDIYMLHTSLLKYEFDDVYWRGRSVCVPVMRVESRSKI